MAEHRPPIWVVSRVFPPDAGGVQTYARQLALAYGDLGHPVSVFAKSSAGPRRIGHGIHRLIDVGPGRRLPVYARLLRALGQAWREGPRPAMIHACTWRAALVAIPLDVPLIVTVHGREIGRPTGMAFRLMRFALERATRIVAVSDTTRDLLVQRLPHLAGRCVVAWNGPSGGGRPAVSPAGADSSGDVHVLTVCRLVPRKNVAGAIRAVASLVHAGHRLRYSIAGAGDEMPALRALIDRLGVGGAIELLGYVDDDRLERLYAAAGIFLHPQIALEDGAEIEGFGISVADAMAHGLACIVGRNGGPAEFVRDEDTGLIVDGRQVGHIADALSRLLRDPALRRAIGRRACLWASDSLSWDHHCRISLGDEPAGRLPSQVCP
jgi:glycosyltransferase involved in cell wall biosynthesis